MKTKTMDGQLFKTIITNGAVSLKNNMERINQLNVFPVPDGDTGSNMSATMNAGAKSLINVEETSISVVAKALARGMLMGARGNSGVILSQLFSGLSKGLVGLDTANVKEFSKALRQGVEQAYSAVINPVEGTMLTVSREGADRALEASEVVDTYEELFPIYLKELYESLARTPDLLPVLKEVGVIDSGAAGFIEVVEGMHSAVLGKMLSDQPEEKSAATQIFQGNMDNFHGDTNFGYCTEFIMQIEKVDEFSQKDFIEMISPLGDSLVVVQDENILKVHIHTQTPGDALNLGQRFGFFINMKIENMSLQHSEVLMHQPNAKEDPCDCGHEHQLGSAPKHRKKYGIIAVVNGDGLKETFVEMGCDIIIDGGQTMNPSIEDFVKAVDSLNAEHVILIPNNKNVLLSAETAAKMIEDRDVQVLPAKTIAQGYASLTMFDATQSVDQNLKDMTNHLKRVKTGEVTYAIRESVSKGNKIAKDDFMGIFNGEIVVSVKNRIEAIINLFKSMIDSNSEIVTIMYGKDVDNDEIEEVKEVLESGYSVEVETIDGGQDIYSYIISVE
ncbi:MAG: DAK2 domain-containing protein [bacterium]|nr:DAK2 domain-containing protein [bacterium]